MQNSRFSDRFFAKRSVRLKHPHRFKNVLSSKNKTEIAKVPGIYGLVDRFFGNDWPKKGTIWVPFLGQNVFMLSLGVPKKNENGLTAFFAGVVLGALRAIYRANIRTDLRRDGRKAAGLGAAKGFAGDPLYCPRPQILRHPKKFGTSRAQPVDEVDGAPGVHTALKWRENFREAWDYPIPYPCLARRNMTAATAGLEGPKSKGRSRITNGNALFEGIDGRSATARRFRDVLAEIVSDLGGPDRLSEGQRQIARRCAMLAVECEKLESLGVAGKPFDIEQYGQLTDRMGRAFQRLGLKRQARNITPSVADYIAHTADDEEVSAP